MQFLLGAHGHQLAHVHNPNAIGHFLCHAQLVCGEKHGHPLRRTFLEYFLENILVMRI